MNVRRAALFGSIAALTGALGAFAGGGCGQGDDRQPDAGQNVLATENATPDSSSPVTPPIPTVPAASDTSPGLLFDPRSGFVTPDAGLPPPIPMRPDTPPPGDTLMREDLPGVALEAELRFRKPAAPPKAPEVSLDGIAKAAKATQMKLAIDLYGLGRMRFKVASRAFPFPFNSELRSRIDRTGHFLIWPDADKLRVLSPGSLRSSLAEGRADVTPLATGNKASSATGKRLGEKTRTVTLEAPLGKLRLELATVPEAAYGGPLLCRLLVEMMAIDPATSECKPEEVPLFAGFDWTEGDGIDFEVTALTRKTDLPASGAVAPPVAEVVTSGLPESPLGVYLTRDELAVFRTKAIETKAEPNEALPGEGIVFVNGQPYPVYALIDGVVVAMVKPGGNRYVIGPLPGRYSVQWRDFLGEHTEPPEIIDVPARVETPKPKPTIAPDAGPPP